MKKGKKRHKRMGRVAGLVLGISLMSSGMGAVPARAADTDVVIDENNFPDSVFREYVKSFDENNNDILEAGELNQVTEIDVNGKDTGRIMDLKGLEFFDKLESLKCSQQWIMSLDLSKNTELTFLDCSNTSINALDLSNNTQLEFIMVMHCDVETLDFSNNPNLQRLWCTGNQQLTKLNISSNTELYELYCIYLPRLESLDVSNNTKLQSLTCSECKLTSLDVSKNTQLESLVCGNNKLSSLDVRSNTQLVYLDCSINSLNSLDVSNNSELETLICGKNNLSSLDVSNNTKLKKLSCNANHLSGLDLSSNSGLDSSELKCGDNQINAPLYKSNNTYYINLSAVLPNKEKAGNPDKGTYDNTTGRINLSGALAVGDTLTYDYATGFGQEIMTVTVTISEIKEEISTEEPSTEEPSTEEPSTEEASTEEASTEEPSTEEPSTEEASTEEPIPAVTEMPSTIAEGTGTYAAPKTGDTAMPLVFAGAGVFSVICFIFFIRKRSFKEQ